MPPPGWSIMNASVSWYWAKNSRIKVVFPRLKIDPQSHNAFAEACAIAKAIGDTRLAKEQSFFDERDL
jgi:hypothetical protein